MVTIVALVLAHVVECFCLTCNWVLVCLRGTFGASDNMALLSVANGPTRSYSCV